MRANKDRIAQDVEKGLKESFGELEIEIINHEELEYRKAYTLFRTYGLF